MNVTIRRIKDKGIEGQERIVLDVINDCDIGKYFILDTTYNDGTPTNLLRHTYWFPDRKVSAGDIVVLYTKEGNSSEKKNSKGTVTHFFYWDLDIHVWNADEDCAVLVEAKNWEFHKE